MSDVKDIQPVLGAAGDMPKAALLDDDEIDELLAKKAEKAKKKKAATY